MTQPYRFIGKLMICALALVTPILVVRSFYDQRTLALRDQRLKSALSDERRDLSLRVAGRVLDDVTADANALLKRDLITGEIQGLEPFIAQSEFHALASISMDEGRPLSGAAADLLRSASAFFSGMPKAYPGLVEVLSGEPVVCTQKDADRLYQVAQELFRGKSLHSDQFALLVSKLPTDLRDVYAVPLFFAIGGAASPADRLWIRRKLGRSMQFLPAEPADLNGLNRSLRALDLDAAFQLSPNWLDLGPISANLQLVPVPQEHVISRLFWIHLLLLLLLEGVFFLIFGVLLRYERLSRMQKTFLAAGTHELRTPLAVIRQFSEMLLDRKDRFDDKIQKYHQFIHKECLRMQFLVENLLSQARMERMRTNLNCQEFELADLLREIVQSLAPIYDHRIDCDCPELSVVWDRVYMSQVIINLLDNAQRHGRTDVQLDVRRFENDVVLTVRDFGPRFDEDKLHEIRGFRSDLANKKGLGLGLILCRMIVKAHGGGIHFAHANPGLAVRVRLPRRAPKSALTWRGTAPQRRR